MARLRKNFAVKKTRKILFILALAVLVSACATLSESTYSDPEQPIESLVFEELSTDKEIDYGSFTEEQLYQTIISELGAQRGDLKNAGENYLDLAITTKDLAIIQRAIQFASLNGDLNALMQLGLLWSDVEPSNTQPHLMLSFQFLENGNYEQALSHMARVLDLGGDIDFTALTSRTSLLSEQERESLINSLKQLTKKILNKFPGCFLNQ